MNIKIAFLIVSSPKQSDLVIMFRDSGFAWHHTAHNKCIKTENDERTVSQRKSAERRRISPRGAKRG